jgi:hypothetical protein
VDPSEDAQHEFPYVDNNPTDVYGVTRTEITNKTEFVIPAVPQLRFRSNARYLSRQGMQQARTFDMCKTCHIDGQSQAVNQRTMDLTVGVEARVGKATVSYSHFGRRFESRSPALIHNYTNPYRRFDFQGEQEFAHIPDSEKSSDNIKAKVDIRKGTTLFGSYTAGRMDNTDTGGRADVANFLTRLSSRLFKGLKMSVRYLSNVYENRMDGEHHLSKDRSGVGADVSYRSSRKVSLRGGVEYQRLIRETPFAVGDEEFDRHLRERRTATYRVGAMFYPTSRFNGFVRYKTQNVSNPLGVMYLPEDNPIDPTVDRFMTSLYTDVDLLSSGITFVPTDRLSLTTNFYMNSSENADIGSSHNGKNFVFSGWYALADDLSMTASYSRLNNTTRNDLLYGSELGLARESLDVPYVREVNVFLVSTNFKPSKRLSLSGDVSYTEGRDYFTSENVLSGVDTSGIAALSDQDLSHLRISTEVAYLLGDSASLFGRYRYEDYADRAFILYSDSGSFHLAYVGVGYRF